MASSSTQLIPSVDSNGNVPPIASPTSNSDVIPSLKDVNPAVPGSTTAPTSKEAVVAPVSADETTAEQMRKLLSTDSPYLQLARSQSQQAAASRGLQNSSIAAGAGESAAIGAALPIAQQDAATYAARANANLGAQNQFGLTAAQAEEQRATQAAGITQQTAATKELQQNQGDINQKLQAQAEAANIAQIIKQGDVNAMLQSSAQAFSAVQASLDRGQQLTLADVNFQNQMKLTMAQISANSSLSAQESSQRINEINQQSADVIQQIQAQAEAAKSAAGPNLVSQYLASVSQIMQATSSEIQTIYSTQGLTALQQSNAVAKAQQQMNTNLANLQSFYKSSPLWDANYGSSSQSGVIPSTSNPDTNESPPDVTDITTRLFDQVRNM